MADGQGPVLAPSVSLLHKGTNRYGFALFDTARKQVTSPAVALYTARQTGRASAGRTSRARSRWRSSRSSEPDRRLDPNSAKSVYVADMPFRRNGLQAVVAIARLDGRLLVTTAPA